MVEEKMFVQPVLWTPFREVKIFLGASPSLSLTSASVLWKCFAGFFGEILQESSVSNDVEQNVKKKKQPKKPVSEDLHKFVYV